MEDEKERNDDGRTRTPEPCRPSSHTTYVFAPTTTSTTPSTALKNSLPLAHRPTLQPPPSSVVRRCWEVRRCGRCVGEESELDMCRS